TSKTWNGTSFASGTNTVNATSYDGSSGWTYSFPNTNFDLNGSYTVSASATDRANNTGTSATNSFKYDTVAPVSTDNNDHAWHNAAYTVHLSATDATSGVATVNYKVDGGTTQT